MMEEPAAATRRVEVGGMAIGGGAPLALIAGPCVIEAEDLMLRTAESLRYLADRLGIGLIFKSSYLKDNRSSADSYQGPGLEKGLRLLEKIKATFDLPVLSDVHTPQDAAAAAEVLDVIQIPAYLSMQTGLTLAAARTGKVVNVKKGQFLDPGDMKNVIGKIESAGNRRILLTERGTFFGYHNLVVDFRSLPIMRSLGYPVVFDPTHSVRVYGVPSSDPAGGRREFVPALTRAGVAAGCDALFIETHPCPGEALCDAASQWPLGQLEPLLRKAIALDQLVRAETT
jgi:2-dehydro-3-deoxyphosphooctonate aldolase (KDO 8-P synthase)